MSNHDDEIRLPEQFEAMLRDWPAPERDETAWAESADSIQTRIAMARRAPAAEKLFEPPLPREEGESMYPPPSLSSRPANPIPTDELDGGWGADEELGGATVRMEARPTEPAPSPAAKPRDLEEDTLTEDTLTAKLDRRLIKTPPAKPAPEVKPEKERARLRTPKTVPAPAAAEAARARVRTPVTIPVASPKPAEPPRTKSGGIPVLAIGKSAPSKEEPTAKPVEAVMPPRPVPPVITKTDEPIDEVLAHATVGVMTPVEKPPEAVVAERRPSPVPVSAPQPESAPRSLVELAKQSLAEQAEKDSAAIARESLSLASKSRATPAAALPTAPALSAVSPPAPPTPAPGLVAPTANVIPMSSRPPPKRRSAAGPIAGAVILISGLAAGAFIFVRAHRAMDEATVARAPAAAEPSAVPAPTAEPAKAGPEKGPQGVAINDLPQTPEAAPGAPRPSARTGAVDKPGTPAAAPAEDEKKAVAPPPKEKDEEGAKMKPAMSPTDLPDHPSTGAVQAAIGSVLGSARACVAGQDLYSQAVVTFAADGTVQSVKITGGAAGKPPEACIQAALMKARVQPFARPTFSVSATIRP